MAVNSANLQPATNNLNEELKLSRKSQGPTVAEERAANAEKRKARAEIQGADTTDALRAFISEEAGSTINTVA